MKQPELGKKIADLRKARGFTQEELVDKCNINVRTIQRIEAGEVTPRNYTIRTILGALDYDFGKMQSEFTELQPYPVNYTSSTKTGTAAFYMGIVFLLLGFVEFCIDMDAGFGKTLPVSGAVYVSVKLVCLVSMLFFYRGFVSAGILFDNYLLKVSALFIIAVFGVSYVFDIFFWFVKTDYEGFYVIVSMILISCGLILNGIGILRLKPHFGASLTGVTGILTIVSGATLFVLVGLALMIPATVLQLVLMYRVKTYKPSFPEQLQ